MRLLARVTTFQYSCTLQHVLVYIVYSTVLVYSLQYSYIHYLYTRRLVRLYTVDATNAHKPGTVSFPTVLPWSQICLISKSKKTLFI